MRCSTSAPTSTDSVDYPDFGYRMAEAIAVGRGGARRRPVRLGHRHLDRGQPQSRLPLRAGLRAASPPGSPASITTPTSSRMGARLIGIDMAKDCVDAFLATHFAGGRHQRRVDKLSNPDFAKETA